MICRLCLCDLDDTASVFIFSDADYSLPKVIAKYLQVEVPSENLIQKSNSNKLLLCSLNSRLQSTTTSRANYAHYAGAI